MFLYDNLGHTYSIVLVLNGRSVYARTFSSRDKANSKMYKLMGKYNLQLRKVYDDNHDKTYKCTDHAEFHINRVF